MSIGAHREMWVPVALYARLIADDEVLPAFVTSISEHGPLFNDTSIRFLAMADSHWRSLRRWVRVRELVLATRPMGAYDAA